ncbi:MAG: hypothetical protein DYH06_14130 [Acidobacteria bacterium ACB2]|nr:hypothetical protein [Acidobacteria bacterium ACB2]
MSWWISIATTSAREKVPSTDRVHSLSAERGTRCSRQAPATLRTVDGVSRRLPAGPTRTTTG